MPPDSHHLFLSYARADNRTGRVSEFVGRFTTAYRAATARNLLIFFDADSLGGGTRWLDHNLRQLKQSKILLACLSPGYLESDFCRQELAEYLKVETGRGPGDDGFASEASASSMLAASSLQKPPIYSLASRYGPSEVSASPPGYLRSGFEFCLPQPHFVVIAPDTDTRTVDRSDR